MSIKAGYAAIVGKPNVGKSTLLNQIIGSKLSIVTPKAQTTRKRVLGIFSDDENQIVFLDTPGILEPKHKLHEAMLKYIDTSLEDADIILFIIDAQKFRDIDTYLNPDYLSKLQKSKCPVIAVVNKIDLIEEAEELDEKIDRLKSTIMFDEIIQVSALNNEGVEDLVKIIKDKLPESEFFFDPELLSTLPQRFFVSEIIREKIFTLYSEEIPYSSEVAITEFKERKDGKWYIAADIVIERTSQKKIVIGKKGSKIKELGTQSRIDIEEQLGMPIYLELFVKVREKWRKKDVFLRSFGYIK